MNEPHEGPDAGIARPGNSARTMMTKEKRTTVVAGVWYDNMTVPEALARCVSLLDSSRGAQVFFLNADCLRIARQDSDYREILSSADLVLPDGIGLRLATRLFGSSMRDNCNGTDFSPWLMRELAKLGKTCFLLGGREGVAAQAARNVSRSIAGLRIVGSHSGYFNDDDAIVREINASGADVLFVGMGAPLQEKWIGKNKGRMNTRINLGVGALFDYLAGNVRRAPRMLQVMGLEWAWRIYIDPRRMVKRYLLDGIPFMVSLVYLRIRFGRNRVISAGERDNNDA